MQYEADFFAHQICDVQVYMPACAGTLRQGQLVNIYVRAFFFECMFTNTSNSSTPESTIVRVHTCMRAVDGTILKECT